MDLPVPEWTQHAQQRWTELGSAGRETLALLTDTDELFRLARSLVRQDDVDVMSRVSERFPVEKSAERAVRFREQGNVQFKTRDYTSAALHYTRGVCHAGTCGEQLSLCYANRSAALFHLGRYSECLEDVQRALSEGYPDHLQHKLMDRREQCVKRLEQQEPPSSEHQTPRAAEEAAGNTCLRFTPERGRHLLAAEDMSAGQVVLRDEAFSFVLIPSDMNRTKPNEACTFGAEHRFCHHCLRGTLSAVPCAGCSYAQYCGRRCADEAWRQYHRSECPAGSELLALGVLAHLAVRVTLKAGPKEVQRARRSRFSTGNHGNSDGSSCGESSRSLSDLNVEECSECSDHSHCYHGKAYLGVYSLLPHLVGHAPSLRFLLAFTAAALCQRLEEVNTSPETRSCEEEGRSWDWREEQGMLGTTALRHMMQLRCNAQAVTAIRVEEGSSVAVQSSEEVRVATAVFPVLSLLNHSCCPNTSVSFSLGLGGGAAGSAGVTATIRTSRDVSAGQELLHCYGPHCSRMNMKERQRLLLEQYFFHCHCEACKLDVSAGAGRLAASRGFRCERCGSSLQVCGDQTLQVCSQSSCKYRVPEAELQRRVESLQDRLDRALELMEQDRPDSALRVLQEAGAEADRVLLKTHRVQGALADATARVYASLGNWSQAASYLERSIVAARCQFGEDSVEVGQQLFKLTQLYFNGRDRKSALSVIPSARRILHLHCDPHCEELQELQQMESCLHGAA